MSTGSVYVAEDGEGFWQWVETGSGSEWRGILSSTGPTVDNATFFLVPGPNHGQRLVLSTGSATVPAGSFTTVEALYDYQDTGQYATEDIFETGREHYADGVGLVLAKWNYCTDDNDPRAADVTSRGRISLTHMDTGPFPAFVVEAEPNDTTTTAGAASAFAIISGDIEMRDSGAIMTDSEVGCSEVCIHPNINDKKKLQDWYRFEVTQTTDIRIELDFELYLGGTLQYNDLDLYAFQESGTGPVFIGSSVNPEHEEEMLVGTLQPGTYYLAIQAWTTPGERVSYWLSIR